VAAKGGGGKRVVQGGAPFIDGGGESGAVARLWR
jgi:hypothetical protein